MSTTKKGIKFNIAIITLLVVACLCIGTGFTIITITKSSLANKEAKLPESAISLYLKQVKNNDFTGIYENSLLIDPHLNSEEDYNQEIKTIYDGVDLDNLIFQKEKSESNDLLYGLYDNNTKVAVIKLVKDSTNKWLASTVFEGNHSILVEVSDNITFKVNGIEVGNEYMKTKDVAATNFSGLSTTSTSPKINQYELNNLITEPTITVDKDGYSIIKDVLSNTYFIGKTANDSTLEEMVINAAKTCARYPTKDGSLNAIRAITIIDSDFYNRIKTMDNQWFAAHGTSKFSNEEVLSIIQQDDNSMIANVIFDYYIGSGSITKEYHIGYQISLLQVQGSWKIAGFAIDNEMNPKTKKW